MLVHLILSQSSLRLTSFLFILFLCSVLRQCFPPFCPPSHLPILLLLIPSSVLFISFCLFFSSSRSLVNMSCIFSIFASILFPRSWIFFTVIILNSFSGRLPISTLFSCFFWNLTLSLHLASPVAQLVKHLPAVKETWIFPNLIPELGRSPGEVKGYPLQYSGLENSMDCIVQVVTKSLTWLSNFHFIWDITFCFFIMVNFL